MKKLLLIALVISAVISCSKGSDGGGSNTPTGGGNNGGNNNTCTGTKSFANDVSAIIQSVCATSGCHNAGSGNGPGALTTYQQIFNARTSIRSAVSSGTMPKSGTLSTDQKNAILCWIDQGANNN